MNDEFKFEKIVKQNTDKAQDDEDVSEEDQVNAYSVYNKLIYYIDHIGTWITIDQNSGIHLWDLETEK